MPNSHFPGVVPNNESNRDSIGMRAKPGRTTAPTGFVMIFAMATSCEGEVAITAKIRETMAKSPVV